MQGWAKVNILGTLGGDAEIRSVGGATKCELRVAVTETWKDKSGQRQESTTWLKCVDWMRRPDWMVQSMTKGTPVAISGSLREETWEKDGVKHHRVYVHVQDIEVLQKRTRGEQRFPDGSGSLSRGKDDHGEIPF